MEGADLDALLEAKYEHDLDEELIQQLQFEEGNDETFGSLSEPLGESTPIGNQSQELKTYITKRQGL